MRCDRRGEAGQAAGEYVAVLALVAAVLVVGAAALAPSLPGVANAVVGQLRRALCVVTGSACRAEAKRACVVSTDREARHLAATVALVRLDDDHVLLRERLSDGTVRITIAEHSGAGVEVGLGGHARLEVGGRSIGFGTELRAALLGVAGDGRVFHADGDEEADELVREVMGRELPLAVDRPYRLARDLLGFGDGPEPDERYFEGGARVVAEAGLRARGGGLGAGGLAAVALGGRLDHRTGERTVYLRTGRGGSLLASALLGTAAGSVQADAALALTVDRERRPVELSLLASGALAGGARLPGPIALALGTGAGGDPRGRRWELHARADLTAPGLASAWAAYRRAPASPAALRALGERLARHARLDARTYRTTSSTTGASGGIGAGLKLAGEAERTLERSSLLNASTRPPGGLWERRVDCQPARVA